MALCINQQKNPAVHLRETAGPEQRRGQAWREIKSYKACFRPARRPIHTALLETLSLANASDDTSFFGSVQHFTKNFRKFLQAPIDAQRLPATRN
jgi:hypothetical protein